MKKQQHVVDYFPVIEHHEVFFIPGFLHEFDPDSATPLTLTSVRTCPGVCSDSH